MGMIACYVRMAPAELEHLLENPDSIADYLDSVADDEQAAGGSIDLDKAWHAIHFLLTGSAWEGDPPLANAVLGGAEMSDEDLGYGPPRCLDATEVREVAAALRKISGEQLWSRFDADTFADAEIYPAGWDLDGQDKDYVVGYYEDLRRFFRGAAAAGDAVVLYLS